MQTLRSLESFLSKAAKSAKTTAAQQSAPEEALSIMHSALFAHRCEAVPLSAVSQAAKALKQAAGQAAAQQTSPPG